MHKWNRNQCFYCMADIVHQLFKHWVLLVSIHNITFKYPLGNCWQPYGNASDTAGYLGNPEYSDCLILCKCFLQRTQSSNKRWRPKTICLRVSIVFIRTNPAKIRILWQLHVLLATQVFDVIWVANSEYQIPPNTYMHTSL